MELDEIRKQIDVVDDEIKALYLKRLELVANVSSSKKQTGKNVFDPDRERKIILRVTDGEEEENQIYLKRLYETIFESSRAYQSKRLIERSPFINKLAEEINNGKRDFPVRSRVACQGVEGAYSGIASDKLFEIADVTYFKNFDGVFSAVEKGLCQFGVLPIENSYAGSVNSVYDLMKEHKFYIVKSIKLPIVHNLVANKGATTGSIKEIYSHEQAISQCRKYLEKFPNAVVKTCANTAVAAKMVQESGRTDIAAISSRECAELYGLKILESGVQDTNGNYTRFILITKDLAVYKGANRISIMTTLSHKPGSLNKLLAKFSSLGINLTKLESRPMTGSDFEFMFYFDFECDVSQTATQSLLAELDNSSEQFTFLGAYTEV